MVIPFSSLLQPGPSFDQPLEMLATCHDRITDQCRLLEKLLPHVAAHGPDEQSRDAANGVLRYFDLAGEHHHLDEELELFPALRKHAGEQMGVAEELIKFILHEHELMRRAWKLQLRPQLLALRDGLAALKPQTIEHFTGLYLGHIEREENELLPFARQILGEEPLRVMGLAMTARRKTA